MLDRVHNLGEIGTDVLIFGGPYSNLQATQALFAEAGRRGVDASRVICTGDVVAYGADPASTVACVRAFGCHVVAGNCEAQLARGADDCGCGFEEGSVCEALSDSWYAFARQQIDQDARNWMTTLPDVLVCSIGGRRVAVVHGGVTDRARFLWPSSPAGEFEQEIAAISDLCGPLDMVISGHCGIPFHRQLAGVDWINAGVIGMPPHDGRPETRYAVLGPHGPVFHRLAYDHEAAATAMRAVGLTQGYELSLTTGLWPDETILPVQMLRDPTSLHLQTG